MKKLLIIIALIYATINVRAQSLTKNSEEAETFMLKEFCKVLYTKLSPKSVPKGYVKSFSVKFEMNEKAEPINVQLSVNMADTLIINIVKSVLAQSQKIWVIAQCKKYNPTLRFILPIHMEIYSRIDIDSNGLTNRSHERLDFNSLIKFSSSEQNLEVSFSPSKEKFVGMVLNPIIVSNTKPFE